LPFLPLERRHVEQCIVDELKRRGVTKGVGDARQHVMEQIRFDEAEGAFAKSGCKDVSNKVNMVVDYSLFGEL